MRRRKPESCVFARSHGRPRRVCSPRRRCAVRWRQRSWSWNGCLRGPGRIYGYPAHGDWVEDGKAKVREYIEHRQQREKEAIEVLSRARDDGEQGWGSMELVKVIYSAYPEALHLPAEGSLKHVLRKLQGEGKVKEERGRWLLAEREEGKL
jgi:hypothetical protein